MQFQKPISVILLAGGVGSRMNSTIPKQFLELGGKKIIDFSFEFLHNLENVEEIIVVCDPSYRSYFKKLGGLQLKFAAPGLRRQDSVYNGLKEVSKKCDFVLIHDGARPFLNKKFVETAIQEAHLSGAATLATPLKFTVKEASADGFVKKTVDRSTLFEIQTPQIIKVEYLKKGFKLAQERNLEVTDDVSFAELIGKPVKLVMGSYQNIKITTSEDLKLAENLLKNLP